ncbi:hypothetical protein HDV63DRAFT_360438 [Trichoderma sp. SZMC 28014]
MVLAKVQKSAASSIESADPGARSDATSSPTEGDELVIISNAISNPKSTYRYSSLPVGWIRLLRLLPHPDEDAIIKCELVHYPLLSSGKGTHLYEALSYVWGSEEKPRRICVDGDDLYITENLHTVLLRLRDAAFERIIWADGICINQDDIEERSLQVQYMMNIYSRASRVIVWLEETIHDADSADTSQAIEEIGRAADGQLTESSNSEAIRAILQRSWFQRIWVLQEVAAARHVLIMCHAIEIDGDAFCAGLIALNLALQDPELQSRIRSAIYLIKNAGLRPKHVAGNFDKFSLGRRSLGELVDMYHNRKAKDWRDKIYALLGMSLEIPVGLTPDYNTPWKDLFRKVICSFTGEQASIETWKDKDFAIIKTHGRVIGTVSSASTSDAWSDQQDVGVNIDLEDNNSYREEEHDIWAMQASAKPIRQGDIICLVSGASKPMILRPCEDYFCVIVIAATPRDLSPQTFFEWPEDSPNRELLLVWDWRISPERPGDSSDYDGLLNGRVSGYMNHLGKAARLHCIGQLLKDARLYHDAVDRLKKAIEAYNKPHGKTYLQSLAQIMTYSLKQKAENLGVAADILGQRGDYATVTEHGIIQIAELHDAQIMKLLQDRHDSRVLITENILEAAAGNSSSGEAMLKLLFNKSGDISLITEDVMKAAALNYHYGLVVMKLLLNWCGEHAPVTEEVVKAAAANNGTGCDIIRLLLDRYGNRVPITLDVIQYIAESCSGQVMIMLLDRLGDQVPVSEEVILAAARNKAGYAMIRLLFERRRFPITRKIRKPLFQSYEDNEEEAKQFISQYGDQLPLAKDVVTMVRYSSELMVLLLDRSQDRSPITKRAMEVIMEYFFRDGEVMQMLLERHGDQIPITEEFVKTIAKNYDGEMMKLLLDRRGNHISFTREMLEAAAENDSMKDEVVMELLKRYQKQVSVNTDVAKFLAGRFNERVVKFFLDLYGEQVPVDEEMMKAAAESRYGEEVIAVLLSQKEQVPITEEVLKAAAGNPSGGAFESLLNWLGDQASTTEEVVAAAAKNREIGDRLLLFLLDKYGDRIPVTKTVVTAAAGNDNRGVELITMLLNKRGDQVPVNEEVVMAAAKNENLGDKLITLLLDERGDQIPITEGVVAAAAENEKSGKEVMTKLRDRRGQIPITEAVVIAAARNHSRDNQVLGLLFDWHGDQAPVTEHVVKAAAGNTYAGYSLLNKLFDWLGDQTPISEEVVKAAAANGSPSVLKLLLDRGGPQVLITEEVVKAAARSGRDVMKQLIYRIDQIPITIGVIKEVSKNFIGYKIMRHILGQCGDQIPITEELVKFIAEEFPGDTMKLLLRECGNRILVTEEVMQISARKCDESVMKLLLDRCENQMPVTEEMIRTVAAENWHGDEVMELLLDRQGDQVAVTEELLKAAAANSSKSVEILELLLDRRGDEVVITEEVLKAAAGNEENGEKVMDLLLQQRGGEIVITEEVVKAAAGNKYRGEEVIDLLLRERGVEVIVTEDIMKAAAGNEESGGEVMALLLDHCGSRCLLS